MPSDDSEGIQIRFDDRHVDPIMDGEKCVTIRYEFEHDLDRGDIVDLVNQNGHKLTAAKIVTQCELRADWIPFADFEGHRRYTTTGELLDELSEYYPDAPLHPKVVLDVIVFETDLIITDGGQTADGTEQDVYRDDRRHDKCKWERAWGEFNAALHADVDSNAFLEMVGEDVDGAEKEVLNGIIETFDEIAEKHNVETFDQCWNGEVEECEDHDVEPPTEVCNVE